MLPSKAKSLGFDCDNMADPDAKASILDLSAELHIMILEMVSFLQCVESSSLTFTSYGRKMISTISRAPVSSAASSMISQQASCSDV
jgi:hypothetical protein